MGGGIYAMGMSGSAFLFLLQLSSLGRVPRGDKFEILCLLGFGVNLVLVLVGSRPQLLLLVGTTPNIDKSEQQKPKHTNFHNKL